MFPDIKKILFATDLSNNCRHAFTYAASMACQYQAGITLLHVMEQMSESIDARIKSFLGKDRWDTMHKLHENNARMALIGKKNIHTIIYDAMDSFAKEIPEAKCDYRIDNILVKNGGVVDTIIQTSIEEKCNIIIISSHKGVLSSTTALSQTSKRIIQESKIPIMIIPPVEA